MLGFRWLARLRENRGRQIFRYWDGRRHRTIDPLVAYRNLDTHPEFDWDTHFETALTDGDHESVQKTVQGVRDVFGTGDLESGGLTEGECLALLMQFSAYTMDLKKSTSTSPTSPEPTESEQPPAEEESPTNAESDSGSISAERTTAEPTPC